MAANNLEEFERVVLPHLRAAYNLAKWLTRNPSEAEDLVQESYLRAFRFFDGFRGGDGKAWLLAIVRNTCFTWLARNQDERSSEVFDERLHSTGSRETGAEDALKERADLERLRACIQILPSDYREAVVMREIHELSYKEIAEVTGVPVGTVMSRLSRGRKRLEDCVTRKGGGLS